MLPSQRQLKWSQLRVGLTVLFATITLAVLIFLMSGSTGLFTKKLIVRAYFDSAGGLRVGAPVRLQDVDAGNVVSLRVVADRKATPVEVRMKLSSKYLFALHKDSTVELKTSGVLGETYVYIDSTKATGPSVQDNDELRTQESPDIQDVVRSSQTTLENMQVLLQRVDRIVATVESGKGSIGMFINDPTLYNRLNTTIGDFQKIVAEVNNGRGTIGKLLVDDTLYAKANTTVDRLNSVLDQVNNGQGTVGKLIKDPSLYNNANAMIGKGNRLMDDINAGHGTIGKLTKDEALAAKIDNTVTKLSMITDRLNAGEGTAGKFLHDPTLYNNTNAMLVETRSLIQAVREHPKRYLTIHLKLF